MTLHKELLRLSHRLIKQLQDLLGKREEIENGTRLNLSSVRSHILALTFSCHLCTGNKPS